MFFSTADSATAFNIPADAASPPPLLCGRIPGLFYCSQSAEDLLQLQLSTQGFTVMLKYTQLLSF